MGGSRHFTMWWCDGQVRSTRTASVLSQCAYWQSRHLSKGNVVLPPDDTSPDKDLDEDALAL